MDTEITLLLSRSAQGDPQAASELMPKLYDELRRVARNQLRKERSDHTLQGTALVNEAYLVLSEGKAQRWADRQHFFRLASQVMRHILVDHARARAAEKRGGDAQVTSLDKTAFAYADRYAQQIYPDEPTRESALRLEIDFVALDASLSALRALSPRQAQVVDLRFFGGLSIEESAQILEISPATVKRDWTMAKLYLKGAMQANGVTHAP
jgi:RNA polymerase sigma-70 factor, ECF subfamily